MQLLTKQVQQHLLKLIKCVIKLSNNYVNMPSLQSTQEHCKIISSISEFQIIYVFKLGLFFLPILTTNLPAVLEKRTLTFHKENFLNKTYILPYQSINVNLNATTSQVFHFGFRSYHYLIEKITIPHTKDGHYSHVP